MKVSRFKKNKYSERCTNSIFIYVYACYRFKDDFLESILLRKNIYIIPQNSKNQQEQLLIHFT